MNRSPVQPRCKKRRFTELQAKMILVRSHYKRVILGKKKRKEQRYYFCDSCRAFHLTSKELR